MTVLHINSSARIEQSNTRIIGQYLIDTLGQPVIDRDLVKNPLPPISAETIVIGAPMYNFGIPAVLKQWVDAICRADMTFKYTAQGPMGLLKVKRAFIITGAGGTPIGSEIDFVSGYLDHICRFIGITDIFHIHLSGSKATPEHVIAQGKQQIDTLISKLSNQTMSGAA